MEYYKKVYIKSVDDLPKEDGYYFVHRRISGKCSISVEWFSKNIIEYWWDNHWFDWYLQQCEEKNVTDEEISAKLDFMNFKTSKEREDAWDLCMWMRSKLM